MTLFFNVGGVDLGNTSVRLGAITSGFISRAENGALGVGGFPIDDPAGSLNLVGLKEVYINETACSDVRMWTGFMQDRTITRGTGASPSLITGAERLWDCNLVDLNAVLTFRVFTQASANRPSESVDARMAWLLTTSQMSIVHDNGYIESAPVSLSATDYRQAYPADVLSDMAAASGLFYYIFWDHPSQSTTLAFQHPLLATRVSTLSISNVLSDLSSTCFAPLIDATLNRDPSRVYSGVDVVWATGATYVQNNATENAFFRRDVVYQNARIKTAAVAATVGNQFLNQISTEFDRLTVTIKVPASQVNFIDNGMRINVKFSHLPGYSSGKDVRVALRQVKQDEESSDFYNVYLELITPIVTDFQIGGNGGVPLPLPGPGGTTSGGGGGGGGTPPCGITDSFDRPNDATGLNISDSGRIWATQTGTPEIVSNQGEFTGVGGGSSELPGPWPVPFHGSLFLTGATIPLLPAYTEASTWGPSWSEFNPGSVPTSVNGTSAYMDSGEVSEATLVPIVDAVNGGFDVFLSLTPGASFTGTPDLTWTFDAAGFTFKIFVTDSGFDVFTSPGGPSDPTGPSSTHYGAGAWIAVSYQYILAGAVVPVETSTPMQFDTYAGFTGGGITDTAQCLINAADSAEFDFGGQVATVGPSIWGPPVNLGITVDAILISGATNAPPTAGFFNTNVTQVVPQISDYSWSWVSDGVAADGTTALHYTAQYVSTGAAPTVGGWDPIADAPAFDVPTPLIYVDVTDGVTHARGWARLPGDLSFPTPVVLDIVAASMTLTAGGVQAIAFNATASLPDTGTLNGTLLHTIESGLGSNLLFDTLDVTGVNRCGTPVIPGNPVSSSIPISIDATGGTDVSVPLSNYLNSVAPGSTVYWPPAPAIYQAAIKTHGLVNVTWEMQGCTVQAPAGGYTEDFSTIYLQSFGGSNQGIVIHGGNFIGTSPTPGVFISGHEGQHAILCDGSVGVEIYGCTSQAMYGDFVEVNSGATQINIHDNTVTNTGRNPLSVIWGSQVEFHSNACPIAGYVVFDVEPNTVSEPCSFINIHDNTTGSWTDAWFAVDGSATGADIHDITVANNTSVGYSLLTLVNPSAAGPESNVFFTGNSSNVAAAGPVLTFKDVDTLVVTGNTQALSSGSLVSDPGCTNTTIGPNP